MTMTAPKVTGRPSLANRKNVIPLSSVCQLRHCVEHTGYLVRQGFAAFFLVARIAFCTKNMIPAVLCTTGYDDNDVQAIKEASKVIPIFSSRNMSLGINLLIELAKKVEERFKNLDKPITIATMGCPVNGPNEAKDADYGIAGAIGEGYIFKKGELIKKVKEENLLDEFEKILLNDIS